MERRETKEQNKSFSYVVCFLLNNLGYNDDIRRFRESVYVKQTEIMYNVSSQIDTFLQTGDCSTRFIATGSKVEGASLPFQGDIDLMLIHENILCAEESSGIRNFNTLKPVYSENVPPGYVRVVKVYLDDTTSVGSLCSYSYLNLNPDGQPYISSTVFNNFCKQFMTAFSLESYDLVASDQLSFSGPACTKKVQVSLSQEVEIMIDIVEGIYFFSRIYLPRWAARTRHYCWPSSAVINEISSMEGYIVPVGSIVGENPDLDWRISYVTAENKLISNLNTIQFKLYIILKMIAKELIYPDFPVISSYVVKNIVLWVCELNPQSFFTADLLLDQIRKCLSFMRTCLQNNHLPNYIIPERNLIAYRINALSKRQLILRVNKLFNDGRAIFSRLSIFKKHSPLALVLAPSSVYFFGKKRDKVEKLYLFFMLQALESGKLTLDDLTKSSFFTDKLFTWFQDERCIPYTFQLFSIVFPEFSAVFLSGDYTFLTDMFVSRLKLYLS